MEQTNIFNFIKKRMKPSICRAVVYNHPGSADGKYPPTKSPAVVQSVYVTAVNPENPEEGNHEVCDLFVMSNTGGIFFAKGISEGEDGGQWNWPPREE